MTGKQDLEPLAPKTAKDMYRREREGEVTDRTLQAHHYRLVHFIRRYDEEGIDNMNDLSGRKPHEYRLWRKDDGDLNGASLRAQLETLVDSDLVVSSRVISPNTDYSRRYMSTLLGKLRDTGLVDRVDEGLSVITDRGVAYLEGELDAEELEE